MENKALEKKIHEVDGDVFLMSKSIQELQEETKELKSKYENLLNRIKCLECSENGKGCNN